MKKEDEPEMSRMAMQVCSRQVAKRWWFILYEKMAAVQDIQVGGLRMQDC